MNQPNNTANQELRQPPISNDFVKEGCEQFDPPVNPLEYQSCQREVFLKDVATRYGKLGPWPWSKWEKDSYVDWTTKAIPRLLEVASHPTPDREVCSVCCGEGKALSGPCICKGTGTIDGELDGLRDAVFDFMKDREVMRKILWSLRKADIASCTCLTKSPDPQYHKEDCRHKYISEAITALEEVLKEGGK